MSQHEPTNSLFEFPQDGLELNWIKEEPEVPYENETDIKYCIRLDEKYHIKNEEVEICDDKYNVAHHDFQKNLSTEECKLEKMKIETNSNENGLKNIVNSEKLKMTTANETLVTPRKVLKCTLCSFTAKVPSRLKEHFGLVHSEERNFRCSYCDYAAKSKIVLNKHILYKHEDKSSRVRTRHVCHICSQILSSKWCLKIHTDKVHLNVKMKCPDCDYQAKSYYTLKAHILLVHHPEDAFRCYNCEYTTQTKAELKCHILGKHLKHYIYTCDICGDYKTNHRKRIRVHVNQVHSEIRSYCCPHCPYAAKMNKNLKSHILRKHGNKPKKVEKVCHICKKGFMREGNLKNHINNVHLNTPKGKYEDKFVK